jgi:tetratricopeptide (TPR) repeat protein
MKTRVSFLLLVGCCIFSSATVVLGLSPSLSMDPEEQLTAGQQASEMSKNTESSFFKALDKETRDKIKCLADCADALSKSLNGYDALALRLIQQAEEAYPTSAVPPYCEARVLRLLQRNQDAVKAYTRAIELDPGFAEAYARRAVASMSVSTSNLPQAKEDLDRAVRLKPDSWIISLCQGAACRLEGRTADAMPFFETALAKTTQCPDPYVWRAEDYLTSNNLDKAVEDYTKAVELRPDDAGILEARGYAYVQASFAEKPVSVAGLKNAIADFTKAISLCDEKTERFNGRPDLLGYAYYWRGVAYAQTDLAISLADLDKSIYLRTGVLAAQSYYFKGQVQKAQGDVPGAHRSFAEAYTVSNGDESVERQCQKAIDSLTQRPSESDNFVAQHPFVSGLIALVGLSLALDATHSHASNSGDYNAVAAQQAGQDAFQRNLQNQQHQDEINDDARRRQEAEDQAEADRERERRREDDDRQTEIDRQNREREYEQQNNH